MSMAHRRTSAHDPWHEDPLAGREAELRERERQLKLETQAARMLGPHCKTITFSVFPAQAFRELRIELEGGAVDQLTFSRLLELLLWHWREHPPDFQDVRSYEFVTKLGRPRKAT